MYGFYSGGGINERARNLLKLRALIIIVFSFLLLDLEF